MEAGAQGLYITDAFVSSDFHRIIFRITLENGQQQHKRVVCFEECFFQDNVRDISLDQVGPEEIELAKNRLHIECARDTEHLKRIQRQECYAFVSPGSNPEHVRKELVKYLR